MIIVEIKGYTRRIAESQPEYQTLPVKDVVLLDTLTGKRIPLMVSEWEPDAEEKAKIMLGAPVQLQVAGVQHPPVMVSVGEVPVSAATMDVEGGSGPSQELFNWRVKHKDHPAAMGQFVCAPNKVNAIEQVSKVSGLAPDLLFAVADDA